MGFRRWLEIHLFRRVMILILIEHFFPYFGGDAVEENALNSQEEVTKKTISCTTQIDNLHGISPMSAQLLFFSSYSSSPFPSFFLFLFSTINSCQVLLNMRRIFDNICLTWIKWFVCSQLTGWHTTAHGNWLCRF